jgi:hypothetical protein
MLRIEHWLDVQIHMHKLTIEVAPSRRRYGRCAMKNYGNRPILGKIIDLLREEGVTIDSPYDFEHWIEDHTSHSKLFDTNRFKTEDDT